MRYIKFIIIFNIILIVLGCGNTKNSDQEEPTPQEINLSSISDVNNPNWKLEITRVISNKETLEKYAGRLSSLYSAYSFNKLMVKQYANKNSLAITAEVFEFKKSDDAFGLYSFDTIGKKLDIGQDAVYNHGIIRFWKDRIFVRIIAHENYREAQKDILSFAKAIEKNIPYESEKPQILKLIPEENLVPDSLCFFHQNACLNNIYYVPETYALGLSDQTDAVAVQYKMDGAYPRLVIVKYPDESSAQNAYNGFKVLYFDVNTPIYNDDDINVARTEEGEYNSISLIHNYIVLVFESRSTNTSRQLADAALKKIGRKD